MFFENIDCFHNCVTSTCRDKLQRSVQIYNLSLQTLLYKFYFFAILFLELAGEALQWHIIIWHNETSPANILFLGRGTTDLYYYIGKLFWLLETEP